MTGPEGSLLALVVVAVMALGMWLWWGRRVQSPFRGSGWRPAWSKAWSPKVPMGRNRSRLCNYRWAGSAVSVSNPSSANASWARAWSNFPSRANLESVAPTTRLRIHLEVAAQIFTVVAAAKAIRAQRYQPGREPG